MAMYQDARLNRTWLPARFRPRIFSFFSSSLLLDLINHGPAVLGTSVSGTSILAIRSVPGAVMMTALSRCLGSIPKSDVSRHDAAGNVRHAARHHGITPKREVGQERPNRLRRLGLAHKKYWRPHSNSAPLTPSAGSSAKQRP